MSKCITVTPPSGNKETIHYSQTDWEYCACGEYTTKQLTHGVVESIGSKEIEE